MDTTSRIILILILLALIVLSGLFSASETSLMALSNSKIKMRKMKEDNIKGTDRVSKLISDPNKLLSSSIATSLFMDMLGASGVPIATAIMTITVLIFGEITPKSIASSKPEKVASFVSKMIGFTMFVCKPFILLLDKVTNVIFKVFGIDSTNDNDGITAEAIKTLVEVSHEEGLIEEEKKEIIHNVFEFGDMKAKEAMVNRMNIVAINKDDSYEDIIDMFKEERFTRMPVFEENIDNIVGIINVKDIAFLSKEERDNFDIMNYTREVFFTYEFKKVSILLEEMKTHKKQMAIVVDEYGGTSGLLTIENLIEEIVGDIEDEYEIVVMSDREYLVDGSVYISDINDEIGLNLESDNFDSIGGYIIDNLNGFPKNKQVVTIDNVKYVIEDVDKTKINKIKIIVE